MEANWCRYVSIKVLFVVFSAIINANMRLDHIDIDIEGSRMGRGTSASSKQHYKCYVIAAKIEMCKYSIVAWPYRRLAIVHSLSC